MGKTNDELPVKHHLPTLYANNRVSILNLSDVHAVLACYISESLLCLVLKIICGPLHKFFDFIIC